MKKIAVTLIILLLTSLFSINTYAVSTLKYGSSGSDVRLLQTKLIKLGYLKTKATGAFKSATKDAVIRFQRDNKIPTTGVVSTLTWNALNKKTSAPAPSRGGIYVRKPPVAYNDPTTQTPQQTQQVPPANNSSTQTTTEPGVVLDIPKDLGGKTVIIDPGHGFHDPGAIRGSYNEKTFNLKIGLKLKEYLEDAGANVIMTRSTDGSSGEDYLYYRSSVANNFVLGKEMDRLIQETGDIQSQASSIEEMITLKQAQLDGLNQVTTDSAVTTDGAVVNSEDSTQLQAELNDLTNQDAALKTKLYQNTVSIADLQSKMDTFNNYISNPGLKSRLGIMGQANTATSKLAQVFDLEGQNYYKDIVFISIHCNTTSQSETSASGTNVLVSDMGSSYYTGYYKNYVQSKRDAFGQFLLNEMNNNTNFSKKTTKLTRQNLSVLRENNLVSALVEVAYLNNSSDRSILLQDAGVQAIALGMYKGIEDYFNSQI